MKLYILSDIHYDFYLKSYHGNMDRFFEQRFLPADIICIAGDLANTIADMELFLKEVSKRYKNVVLCLGNHDLTITWENGAFKTSEEKIEALQKLCDSFQNVHMLEGRTVTIDGVKFGGCMGMWDYSFLYYDECAESQMNYIWKHNWFDGVHWNYCNQNIREIRAVQFEKMKTVLEEKPDVMLTHFSPLRNNMPAHYKTNEYSTYFYFDNKIADDYLAENSKRIWCSGHVHDAYKDGQILIHPNAYPEEHSRVFNKLHRKDFFLEM